MEDKILNILKQNAIFVLYSNTKCFKIYGCNLVYRSADRAKHKFKSKAASEFIVRSNQQ